MINVHGRLASIGLSRNVHECDVKKAGDKCEVCGQTFDGEWKICHPGDTYVHGAIVSTKQYNIGIKVDLSQLYEYEEVVRKLKQSWTDGAHSFGVTLTASEAGPHPGQYLYRFSEQVELEVPDA